MGRLKATLITFVLWLIMGGIAIADVYINVMAVNGATERRETPIQFNLPADLAVENIIDTDGLKLEYNAADANYYVQGNVTLEPKESKTFRIRLRNIWKIAPEQIQDIKQQIQEGYEQLGKLRNEKNADTLKADLIKRLDYIVQQQANQSGNVERKIDAFRTYSKEMAWIKNQALAIDYWRSQPGDNQARIIRMTIEIENPATSVNKSVKARQYLPSDVRPENLVDDQDFETRYDQV